MELPTDYLAAIAEASLSDATKASYVEGLKRIQRVVGRPYKWIVENPEAVDAALVAAIPNVGSRRTAVSSVLALLKHAGIKRGNRALFGRWYDLHKAMTATLDDEAMDSQARGRAADGYVTWDAVLAARDRATPGTTAHLLLAMYTYIAPRRADYWRTRLVWSPPLPRRVGPAMIDMTTSPRPKLFVFEHKTAKAYDTFEKELPDPLVEAIRAAAGGREYLFVRADGEPFATRHAYTVFCNRILGAAVGANVTVNSLRHAAAAANLLDPHRSLGEQTRFAEDMGHSMQMHQVYRKVKPSSPAARTG